jgi:isopentenyl diphosphate isomerase/L-lactate dehydrogenase-like FMN-dependent dehydrogenase
MNLDEIQVQLAAMANAGDPTFSKFASDINDIVEQAKTGQLSKEDLAEIMRDAQSQLIILEDMSQLRFKETLNTCINGLITIAVWA